MSDDIPESISTSKAFVDEFENEDEARYLIGRFIIEYSQLEFSLRHIIGIRINLPEPMFDAVLGWWDFSKLVQTLEALYELELSDRPELLKERKRVMSRCKAINDERVRVVHSLWTTGALGPIARRVAPGKHKPTFHFEDFRKLGELADEANRLIPELYGL